MDKISNSNNECKWESKRLIALEPHSSEVKLVNALDQLIDSSWDDDDEECDALLASFICTTKESSYYTKETLVNALKFEQHRNDTTNKITGLNEVNFTCLAISHRVSVLINWGYAELKYTDCPNEQRLLAVLNQIQPYIDEYRSDDIVLQFLQCIWNYAIGKEKSDLISKLVTIDPSKIEQIIDNLISIDMNDCNLTDNQDFKILVQIVCIPEVFRCVSSHLAKQEISASSDKIQILLNSILKTLKTSLSKHQYLSLYSPDLKPIVTILNEAINQDNAAVLGMLKAIKNTCLLDFIILVTHFPAFIYLK
ncbi:uncharacterized protein LOC131430596 [Malaya genurostris]|uniref:uncharacterized protein LOC131430596 n=1 Tax=Malaya genurostris TaxID=325434 RepID=UPI0026F3B4B9|nr:uncharacterized protein LOC131430596 [Malaya genurostris]